jgi:hypothetical protein
VDTLTITNNTPHTTEIRSNLSELRNVTFECSEFRCNGNNHSHHNVANCKHLMKYSVLRQYFAAVRYRRQCQLLFSDNQLRRQLSISISVHIRLTIIGLFKLYADCYFALIFPEGTKTIRLASQNGRTVLGIPFSVHLLRYRPLQICKCPNTFSIPRQLNG